jgi:SAM-dependent methyltransferase
MLTLYSIIYNEESILGYDRYYKYANEIINQSEPLKYLADQESTYYPVYKYLKGKSKLKILELGCGYGYLTYAMQKAGNQSFGIDLSQRAINFAKEKFGDYFDAISIEDFIKSCSEKYDFIVATEVVEHLFDVPDFLEKLKKILSPNGRILLTTPNKDFTRKNFVWLTDLPPVHVTWLGKKSFSAIGELRNFDVEFMNFRDYLSPNENKFIKYLRFQKEIIPQPVFSKDGKVLVTKNNFRYPFIRNIIKWCVHKFPPVRVFSNWLFSLFNDDDNTLAVLLKPNLNR